MKVMNKALKNDIALCIGAGILYLPAIGRYGWYAALTLLVSVVCGFLSEYLAAKIRKKKDINFSFPVWILLPLILPPALPLWITGLGSVFATIITVTFFGGYGYQIVSPAATGWAFIILSFNNTYGASWTYPFTTHLEGFSNFLAGVPTTDHPVLFFETRLTEFMEPLMAGAFPQPLGGVVPWLTVILGLGLIASKSIAFRQIISFFATYLLFHAVNRVFSPETMPPLETIFVGTTFFAVFFLLADQRTSPRTFEGRWLIGIVAGISAFLIRFYSATPGGVVFAVLLANVFTPIIDEGVLKIRFGKKPQPKQKEAKS